MSFQKLNNIGGWFVFAVALITYWLTMEETASYWDCGEFIAVSYKLEVPHPPGAPLFLLIGRLFSFLALGDVTKVAYWINFSSVLASAFCVLFLFWTITLFGRKILKETKTDENSFLSRAMLLIAGLIGALTYTFTDSAWFSAVEAEVYAMSSFFTAFVVWAVLKWDVIEDESRANRWLLLIFYMMGLSIGVHLLNLVTIPALALIYYFKKYKPSFQGVIITLVASLAIVLIINDFIIPGLPSIAASFELLFVNSFGLPFGSGALTFTILVIAAAVFGIITTQRMGKVGWNLIINSFVFILIGYASYSLVVIRSNDNTPIDENDPSDVMSFVSYLKREQYGSRPLLYGPYYYARPNGIKEGALVYYKGKDSYEIKDQKFDYTYDRKDQTLLPRLYSSDPDHIRNYQSLLELGPNEKPGFGDNLKFMFQHQIGWMYGRYFMFNFAGRESDVQDANWLGIPTEEVPEEISSNKGRNVYFLIPFFLGLIGLYFQAITDSKNLLVVFLLFVLTGVALVVYLNSPPSEPRERDYIYAGSYYAYSIWVGLGVMGIITLFKNFLNAKVAVIAGALIGLSCPAILAQQNWDDHDRSDRYFSVDSAVNYLESCAPNAVFFTGGDNDTFPLWYAQEVEGRRTDVRVIVLSYYNTDWYVEQSSQQHYDSKPFAYTLTAENYRSGGLNDYLPYYDTKIPAMDLKKFLELVKNNNKGLLHPEYGGKRNMLPTKEIVLKVDVDKVRKLGIVPKGLDSLIVPELRLTVKGGGLEKKDLAMLDLLATSDWERPLYLNNTSLAQFNIDLSRYVVMEGNAYRILPILNPRPFNQLELVNTEVAYKNMMETFQFRNMDRSDVYYNQDYRSFILNHRSSFNTLAEFLILEGDTAKAREVLLGSLSRMPDQGVQYDYATAQTVGLLLEVGENKKALEIAAVMWPRADRLASYYKSKGETGRNFLLNLYTLEMLQRALYEHGEVETAEKIEAAFNRINGAPKEIDRLKF